MAATRSHHPKLDDAYPGLLVSLQGIDPRWTYDVETIDESRQVSKKTMTGAQLAAPIELRLRAAGSLLIRYREQGRKNY